MSGKKEEPPKKKDEPKKPEKKGGKQDEVPSTEEPTCFETCTGWPDWTKYLLYAIPPMIIASPFIIRHFKCKQCPKKATPKPKPKPRDPCCPPPQKKGCEKE